MKKILTLLFIILFSCSIFYIGLIYHYKKESAKAKIFCENLVPYIEEYKKINGVYPANINASWYNSKCMPALINTNTFYIATSNLFLLRYKTTFIFYNNVYGYYSELHKWLQYDGY